MYKEVNPIINISVRALCIKPYIGHLKGCPNFGKKDICPPISPLITDVFDMDKPIYAIYNKFNFGAHVTKMKEKHPNWTIRQLECCLYWQGSARKQLKNEIVSFLKEHKEYHVLVCPEACGVNITETMAQIGINLEWPPKTNAYQIALAGIRRNN